MKIRLLISITLMFASEVRSISESDYENICGAKILPSFIYTQEIFSKAIPTSQLKYVDCDNFVNKEHEWRISMIGAQTEKIDMCCPRNGQKCLNQSTDIRKICPKLTHSCCSTSNFVYFLTEISMLKTLEDGFEEQIRTMFAKAESFRHVPTDSSRATVSDDCPQASTVHFSGDLNNIIRNLKSFWEDNRRLIGSFTCSLCSPDIEDILIKNNRVHFKFYDFNIYLDETLRPIIRTMIKHFWPVIEFYSSIMRYSESISCNVGIGTYKRNFMKTFSKRILGYLEGDKSTESHFNSFLFALVKFPSGFDFNFWRGKLNFAINRLISDSPNSYDVMKPLSELHIFRQKHSSYWNFQSQGVARFSNAKSSSLKYNPMNHPLIENYE